MLHAGRAYEFWLMTYRRSWRATIVSSFLNPVLYITALGVGLGTLVNRGGSGLGVPYAQYVAPGMLAVVAMQIGTFESAWPVMAAIRWTRVYHAMVATPLRIRDVILGQQMYVATRVGLAAAIYLAVLATFGTVRSPYAVLAWPVAILLGVSFSAPVCAFTGWIERDEGYNALFRFGITPLFLFSGTFFPIERLPEAVRWIAYVTPLWHGVDLMRHLTLGTPELWPSVMHIAVMLAWFLTGLWLAHRTIAPRLVS
jgi:lipooligosaccharide transport system permease protein